jgi:DNA polymerase-3 subunit beta
MKFSIDRSTLLKALSHTQMIVERKSVTPILSNVLLSAEENRLSISATDLDLSLIETIPAQIEEKGTTTVSAHLFHDIVRKIPDGASIEISEKPDTHLLTLKSGKAKFSLPTLDAKDFTNIKTSGLPHAFVVHSKDLIHLIGSTRSSMSTEEVRYYLNGIYLHTKEVDQRPVLRTVATDGHRLALAEIDQPQGAHGMPDVIIPRKTITEVAKILEEIEGDVHVSLSLTQIIFNFGKALIASRLIDGAFPDYERVIPSNNHASLTVSRKQFCDVVDRVSTITSDKTKGIRVVVEPKSVTVSAFANNQSMATEDCDATYNGQTLSTGFNARYLLEVAQQIKSETIEFKLSDDNAPAILKGIDEQDVFYVMMPLRV